MENSLPPGRGLAVWSLHSILNTWKAGLVAFISGSSVIGMKMALGNVWWGSGSVDVSTCAAFVLGCCDMGPHYRTGLTEKGKNDSKSFNIPNKEVPWHNVGSRGRRECASSLSKLLCHIGPNPFLPSSQCPHLKMSNLDPTIFKALPTLPFTDFSEQVLWLSNMSDRLQIGLSQPTLALWIFTWEPVRTWAFCCPRREGIEARVYSS